MVLIKHAVELPFDVVGQLFRVFLFATAGSVKDFEHFSSTEGLEISVLIFFLF